jgi:hypothetical protein
MNRWSHIQRKLRSLCLPILACTFASTTLAQTPNQLSGKVEPPTEIVSSPQQWIVHQDWFCPPKATHDPNAFVANMRTRMNALGANGWELVSFTQATVSIVNATCYVATYKAPRKKQ